MLPRALQRLSLLRVSRDVLVPVRHSAQQRRLLHRSESIAPERLLWAPDVYAPLQRVSEKLYGAIDELAELRSDVPLWVECVATLSSIARSPSKHLLRPQQVCCLRACSAALPLESAICLQLGVPARPFHR